MNTKRLLQERGKRALALLLAVILTMLPAVPENVYGWHTDDSGADPEETYFVFDSRDYFGESEFTSTTLTRYEDTETTTSFADFFEVGGSDWDWYTTSLYEFDPDTGVFGNEIADFADVIDGNSYIRLVTSMSDSFLKDVHIVIPESRKLSEITYQASFEISEEVYKSNRLDVRNYLYCDFGDPYSSRDSVDDDEKALPFEVSVVDEDTYRFSMENIPGWFIAITTYVFSPAPGVPRFGIKGTYAPQYYPLGVAEDFLTAPEEWDEGYADELNYGCPREMLAYKDMATGNFIYEAEGIIDEMVLSYSYIGPIIAECTFDYQTARTTVPGYAVQYYPDEHPQNARDYSLCYAFEKGNVNFGRYVHATITVYDYSVGSTVSTTVSAEYQDGVYIIPIEDPVFFRPNGGANVMIADGIDTTTDLGYVEVYLADGEGNVTYYGKCGIVPVEVKNNVTQTINAGKIDLSAMIDASKIINYGVRAASSQDYNDLRLYSDDEAYYLYNAQQPGKSLNGTPVTFYQLEEDSPRTIEWRYSLDVGNILSDDKTYQVGLLENATIYSDDDLNSGDFTYHFENGSIENASPYTNKTSGQFVYYAEYFSIQPPKVREGHAWRYDGNGVFTEVSAEPTAKPETKFVENIAVGDVLAGYTDYLISYAVGDYSGGTENIPFELEMNLAYSTAYAYQKNPASNDAFCGVVSPKWSPETNLIIQGVDGTEKKSPLFVPSGSFNLFETTRIKYVNGKSGVGAAREGTEAAEGFDEEYTAASGNFLIHLSNRHNYEVVSIEGYSNHYSRDTIRPFVTLEEQHVFLEENKEVAETDSFGNITKYVYHCVENDADEYVWLKAKELEYQPIRIAGQDYDEARITSMVEAACENESLLDGEIITKVVDVILETSTDNANWTTVANSDVPSEGWTIKLDYPEGTNKCSYAFVVSHLLTEAENGKQAGELEFPEIALEEDGIVLTAHSFSPFTISYAVKPGVVLSGIAAEYLGDTKNIGDEVTKSELKVTAIYSDGSTRILKDEEYTFSPSTIAVAGTNTVTVVSCENSALTDTVDIPAVNPASGGSTGGGESGTSWVAAPSASTIPTQGVTTPQTGDSDALLFWGAGAALAVGIIAVSFVGMSCRRKKKRG